MTEARQRPGSTAPAEAVQASKHLSMVYDDLRALAVRRLATEPRGQTLQATAHVHEAWLKIQAGRTEAWQGQGHFLATAAEAMRRILVDNARRKRAARHGGGWLRLDSQELADLPGGNADPDDRLLALNEALDRLAAHDAIKAELVKLRYFTGLTIPEAAGVLGVYEPTAKCYWAYSRAWLFRDLKSEDGPGDPARGARTR